MSKCHFFVSNWPVKSPYLPHRALIQLVSPNIIVKILLEMHSKNSKKNTVSSERTFGYKRSVVSFCYIIDCMLNGKLHRFTSISGQDRNKPLPYNPASPVREQLLESFQTSLRNLRTSYLDSYILHSPLSTLEETLEAWKVLGALQDEGRVHLIGVSNAYKVSILQAMAQERPVQVVQNRWYEKNGWDKDVFRYCKENGVMYQYVYSFHNFGWMKLSGLLRPIQIILDSNRITETSPTSYIACGSGQAEVYSRAGLLQVCAGKRRHTPCWQQERGSDA